MKKEYNISPLLYICVQKAILFQKNKKILCSQNVVSKSRDIDGY